MAAVSPPFSRSPFQGETHSYRNHPAKGLPILPSAAAHTIPAIHAMDVSGAQQQAPTALMAPPRINSPSTNTNGERQTEGMSTSQGDQQQQQQQQGPTQVQAPPQTSNAPPQPIGAAAAAQQPKVVQTAFIHKLYSMLEDQSIQHLISWSNTNESFVMSPSSDFSKVLAQYFKHTNISSFVRQLNMYGFHKVSDVFHTGSPEAPLWEFKHGAGNFKRGDLVGLREIKRRASRHALIHRDSFSAAPKLPVAQHVQAPIEQMQDPIEARLGMLEWSNSDLNARLARTEEAYAAMTSRCQALLEGLIKCNQWSQDLSTHLLSLVPDPDNAVHRDVYALRQDISRQVEHLRTLDDGSEQSFGAKPSFFHGSAMPVEPAMPMSPRQRPFDESRRPSLQAIGRPPSFRGPVPSHLQVSPRRYGSIGGSGAYSPTSGRGDYPPPPPAPQPQHQQPHPLANVTSPSANLARRHTSADIRAHSWTGGQGQGQPGYNHGSSPYASGQSSSAWPSSPRLAAQQGDQQIRDALASYELPRSSNFNSRQPSPPPPHESSIPSFSTGFGNYANTNDAGWQVPGAPRYPFKNLETPGGPSRRSSMASNVHSLLNPADTAEREGEDEGPDERKRKRLA